MNRFKIIEIVMNWITKETITNDMKFSDEDFNMKFFFFFFFFFTKPNQVETQVPHGAITHNTTYQEMNYKWLKDR